MDISKLSVNPAKEQQGVVCDLGDGAWVKVASVKNRKFIEAMQAAYKPVRVQLDTNTLPDEKAFEIRAHCVAEHLLLDWGGITENGEEVPYSVETAKKWLTDPAKRPFHDLVYGLCERMEVFQDNYEKVALGNSSEVSEEG